MKVKVKTNDSECFAENEIVCPFCGKKVSDSWEFGNGEEGDIGEIECSNCSRMFYATRQVTVSYSSWPNLEADVWEKDDVFEDGLSEEDEDWANKFEKLEVVK